ncbi:MAG: hypothetical protein J07HX5_01641 [halophilic archaeon J07HX5]|nr:MAG: hypothetical protein J07HX5_01641 [halophilic archaeon J07HX5]
MYAELDGLPNATDCGCPESLSGLPATGVTRISGRARTLACGYKTATLSSAVTAASTLATPTSSRRSR